MTSTADCQLPTANSAFSLRQRLGCWLHERSRAELALARSGSDAWLDLCNRNETLRDDPISGGRICNWQHSSQLTVSRIFPKVGARLLSHCLMKWPICLQDNQPEPPPDNPDASILIAIGGTDRIGQFKVVLKSLMGQSHRSMEIIVVEQSPSPQLRSFLPACVRYFHDEVEIDAAFNKSRALNIAAAHANGRSLIIHDADYVAPCDYIKQCCHVLNDADAVRPARFNFHLDRESTMSVIAECGSLDLVGVESTVQNNPTPIAVRKSVYWGIGGHDESFVGWGGEDVEFLSRLRTKNVCEGGWLPIIHLWHPAAPKKETGDRNQQLQDERLSMPAEDRIAELVSQRLNERSGMTNESID